MSERELQARFSELPALKANEFGRSQVVIVPGFSTESPKRLPDGTLVLHTLNHPELRDTSRTMVEMVDGKVSSVKVYYKKDVKWDSVDEFVNRTAEALNIPDGWQFPDGVTDYKSTFCSNFIVRAGIDSEHYQEEKMPFVEVVDTMAHLEPGMREFRKRENENRKEEERRRTFSP